MNILKEACIGNFSQAIKAQNLGANRLEVCENLFEGGTTPSYGYIKQVIDKIKIKSTFMLRPRGGDFNYTADEIKIMLYDLEQMKNLGVKSVVFGVLDKDKKIDLKNLEILLRASDGLEVVFHKAIDETNDILEATEILKSYNIKRILTSGGAKTAKEGAEKINKMAQILNNKITIVAAGAITKENLPLLSKTIKTTQFHGKKIVGNLDKN